MRTKMVCHGLAQVPDCVRISSRTTPANCVTVWVSWKSLDHFVKNVEGVVKVSSSSRLIDYLLQNVEVGLSWDIIRTQNHAVSPGYLVLMLFLWLNAVTPMWNRYRLVHTLTPARVNNAENWSVFWSREHQRIYRFWTTLDHFLVTRYHVPFFANPWNPYNGLLY